MQRQSEVANGDEDGGDGGYFDGDDDGDENGGDGGFLMVMMMVMMARGISGNIQFFSYPKTALWVAFYTYFPNAIVHGEISQILILQLDFAL